jgi:hypothetical protein
MSSPELLKETCVPDPKQIPLSNPNELLGIAELWLVSTTVFVIFLVGLYKVAADTLKKILK